jgi:ATP-dependent DNA helicase RecG
MTSIEQLNRWIQATREDERLEFKEAKNTFDPIRLFKYCVALANEGGGKLILGVTDKPPRVVVGTRAFSNTADIQGRILDKLRFRVDVEEIQHPSGRVLVFHVPPRPIGTAYQFDGAYLMRSGEELVSMTEDRLRAIFGEGKPDWLSEPAREELNSADVVRLLDTQSLFDMLKLPYPARREAVLERLEKERLISKTTDSYSVTNLGALLFAKRLDDFGVAVARKGPRVIVYEGTDKLRTRIDVSATKGYVVGFQGLIEFLNGQIPSNEVIEKALRRHVKMFPEIAIRELVANALIHQDLNERGISVVVELYSDRLEVSSPGRPFISPDRFIDEYQSRNERLADLMRRVGICEEKGSGIDKVVDGAEGYQLPPPDFRVGERHTTAVLFAHKPFEEMGREDRVRACYQHSCLRYVMNQKMSNQSLRERFKLPEDRSETVSRIITQTIQRGLIKPEDPESTSKRYARYLPYWA